MATMGIYILSNWGACLFFEFILWHLTLNRFSNKNAFQHCVAPKAFVNQANFKAFVNQANFKTFAWITGKKLKSQVNQSN